jgi:hypothetical protein
MKLLFIFKATFVSAALLAWPVVQAANLSKIDYQAGRTRIAADYKADTDACKAHAGNVRDVCDVGAKGRQKVALAELEYGYSGKPADHSKYLVVKAESAYALAKEKCDDAAGNVKDVCIKEAKATETKALADAKMGNQIVEAQTDASQARSDADYGVAVEKCEAMAGEAKTACVTAAKAKYGKN